MDEDGDVFMDDDETNQEMDLALKGISDRDLHAELSLPDVLNSLSRQDKLQLLVFKRSHNEIDWEEELLTRQEAIAHKIDEERLKRMLGRDKETKGKSRKSKQVLDSDDDLSDLGDIQSMGSHESDDDLFDSDEEREIVAKKTKKMAPKNKASQKVTKKSKRDEDDDSDDMVEDRDSGADDDDLSDGAAEVPDTSEPAELHDYLKIQTRRRFVESILREPYFKNALEGTFVRIVVGALPDGNEKVYRMCEIKDVTDNASKVLLPDTNQYTTMRLTVAIGSKEKSRVKFTDISNSRFTQAEFLQYTKALDGSREAKPLSKDQVKHIKSRRDEIVAHHKYSTAEISSMIRKRSGVSKAAHTTHKDAVDNLEYDIKMATAEGRLDDLDNLSKELYSLHEKWNEMETKLKARSTTQGLINQKNYEKNFKKDMNASKLNQQKALSNNTSEDPFIRRQTVPENLWSSAARKNSSAAKENPTDAKTNEATAAAAAATATTAAVESAIALSKKQSAIDFTFENVDMSIDAIRARVKRRLGIDPVAVAMVDPAVRYLKRVCHNFPAKGTAEREAIRGGKSVAKYQEDSAGVAA